MAAYQGSTNRTSRAAPTVQQQQQSQQFAMPRLEDKLIIYGDGLVFGGGPHADPFRSMPQAQTAAPFAQQLPTQGNNSFTGLSNSSMNNLVPPQRMQQQQPWQQQQQQQQQQHLQQQRQQPYSPTNGSRISRNGLNQLPQQQQQQRPLQQQPLQHSMQQQQPQQLVQQQQQQQQPQQQQLQQAYNHWPFGGIAQTNNPNGFGYNQNHAWPGYTVMNPINPNWTYTFGA